MTLNNLVTQLNHARDPKAAEKAFENYLAALGIFHFAFTYYLKHTKTGSRLHYDYVSKALQPWHQYYLEQKYADVDRTLEEGHAQTLPLFWDVKIQLTQAKNKRERRIREESIEYGIDIGLSIPIHGPNGDFASLTLHQCQKEHGLRNYQENQFIWMIAAQLFYHTIRRLTYTESSTKMNLTKREQQCLTLTAKSWRVEQIAKELKISPRTVNFHIQNANKKLGTNNKYQSAYLLLEKKNK